MVEVIQAANDDGAADAPVNARKWLNGITAAIQSLDQMPGRCALAPENDYFEEEIRQLLFGSRRSAYRILFTIREDTVSVLYARHGARLPIRPHPHRHDETEE